MTTYNTDIKWQKAVDNQKETFTIKWLEVCKFRSKVCYNELWYFYLVTGYYMKFLDLINLQFCPLHNFNSFNSYTIFTEAATIATIFTEAATDLSNLLISGSAN